MPKGGKREGAGRKFDYGEETTKLIRRVPKSKYNEIAEKVDDILDTYKKKEA